MNNHKSKLRARSFKPSALAWALCGVLGGGAAHAQSTSGDISGSAAYVAGESVRVQGLDQGFSREVGLASDGRFRLAGLPIGRYQVNLLQDGKVTASRDVVVVAGQQAAVNFNADPTNLQSITVSAHTAPPIDVSSVESRSTFSATQLNTLPVPRNVVAVAMLTPGTIKGNSVFGNLPSFGGSSVAENSYYVNGFNTTNLYDSLSFSEVPFQAIEQLDVQTGGYGAQYGFSTGGVTSVNVKRGTNEFKGGFSVTSTPDSLSAKAPTTYRDNGTTFRSYNKNSADDNVYTAWFGGPLIKDKLFFFVLGQFEKQTGTTYGSASTTSSAASYANATAYNYTTDSPYWVVKLDWNINDDNHLEYTGFDDTTNNKYSYYKASYDADGTPSKGAYTGADHIKTGGTTHILKYTSYLTDELTLSMQYGKLKTNNSEYTVSPTGVVTTYDGSIDTSGNGCPYVAYRGTLTGPSCYISSQQGVYGGYSTRKSGRLDLDWKLGDHDIGIGYADERWKSKAGSSYAGGHYYYYYSSTYVYDYVYKTGGEVDIRQKSGYLEDHWQATDNLMLYGGIRNDNFLNKNGSGDVFVKQNHIWQPRLGFSWDMLGDGSTKVFGTAGRYSLPIAANVALRAASASLYTVDLYTYSSISATGAPVLSSDSLDHTVFNGENGSTPNAAAVASKNLKPYTQDEFILGFLHTLHSDHDLLDNWTVGVKATYRRLKNAIDDTCDSRPLYAAAEANGVSDAWDDEWTVPSGMAGCWIYNPGSALSLTTPLDGTSNTYTVDIPGNQLGPKAKRHYQGLTFSAEKTTDKYYINASYTWSKSYGNTEGLVKSNNGQDDTGTTADFDFAEVMYGANGYLPNDRRHSFKLYGGYNFTTEWSAGLNLLVQSGAPISCYGGGTGTFDTEFGYSAQFHYCNGALSKEGSQGRTPWTWTVSPNVMYKPEWAKGLSFQLNALNIFNNVKPTFVYEASQGVSSTGAVTTYTDYKLPKYYNTPRYIRLQAQYDFSL